MIHLTEQDTIKYKRIPEEIQNSEVPDLLLGIIKKQKKFLGEIKKICNEDQSTYVQLFDRYYYIFNEVININRNKDANKAVLNILQRSAIEISLLLHYLLIPGCFEGINEEEERKFKLALYIYCGYKRKQEEFKKLKENRLTDEEQHENIIQEMITRYWDEMSSNPAYVLCEKQHKRIEKGKNFFLKNNAMLTNSEMVSQSYVNQFIEAQYEYLSSYIHCGYESIIFEKTSENNKDERLLILYLTFASVFLSIRYYFKIDFDSFTEKETAITLDFISLIVRGKTG